MTLLRPMTDSEFSHWRTAAVPAYAQEKIASGQWSAADALARSVQEHADLLPQGLQTPENFFYTLEDAAHLSVGTLWFAVKTRFDARIAYVFHILVHPQHQRKGHAMQAFEALEAEVRKLGLEGIALHVFASNTGARALYAKLGFAPTNIHLFKALTPATA